ncbi:MAG: hypothetical protein LIO68_00860, partial [Rikenellaceae bacterium]|nr:hypothetical protein [Rikenellaceae bacterium]
MPQKQVAAQYFNKKQPHGQQQPQVVNLGIFHEVLDLDLGLLQLVDLGVDLEQLYVVGSPEIAAPCLVVGLAVH